MAFLGYGDGDNVCAQNPLVAGYCYNTIENLTSNDNINQADLSRTLMNLYGIETENYLVNAMTLDMLYSPRGIINNNTNLSFNMVNTGGASMTTTANTSDFMLRNGNYYLRLRPGVAKFAHTNAMGLGNVVVNAPRIKLAERQLARALSLYQTDGSEYVKISYNWAAQTFSMTANKMFADGTSSYVSLNNSGNGYFSSVDMITDLAASSLGGYLNLTGNRYDIIQLEPVFYVPAAGATYYIKISSNTTAATGNVGGVFYMDTTAPTASEMGLWTAVVTAGSPWTVALTSTRVYAQSAFGPNALKSNTTGIDNSAFGSYSLCSNTTGSENSAFGNTALLSNTTGTNNSAFGSYSLRNSTTGTDNSAFGYRAICSNLAGGNNSAFGSNALVSNTIGNNNSAFGNNSLYCNTTGCYNNAFGLCALYANSTGTDNNAFGSNSLTCNTTGFYNNAHGSYSLSNNTFGSSNNAFGSYSLYCNTTGSSNNAFGYTSLKSNTTGVDNNAFGSNSLQNNTTGSLNSAFGHNALQANTIATGNSAFGSQSLLANTTGANNSAFGYYSLLSNTTGANNSAFGNCSGCNITTNTYSSYFGSNIVGTDGTCYETIIGACAVGYGNCSVTLGRAVDSVYIPGKFNAGNTVVSSGVNIGITAAQFGNIIIMTASGTTATLPQLSAVNTGYDFYVKNASTGTITVATYSGDLMDGVSSLVLNQYESIVVVKGGSTWSII